MVNKILPILYMIILIGCQHDDSTDNDEVATCLGFNSPTLSIFIKDSMTDQDITDSVVILYTTTSIGTQNITISWNSEVSSYFVDAESLTEGVYSITASKTGYNDAVIKDLEFELHTSCGSENNWEATLYMCPIGTSCL